MKSSPSRVNGSASRVNTSAIAAGDNATPSSRVDARSAQRNRRTRRQQPLHIGQRTRASAADIEDQLRRALDGARHRARNRRRARNDSRRRSGIRGGASCPGSRRDSRTRLRERRSTCRSAMPECSPPMMPARPSGFSLSQTSSRSGSSVERLAVQQRQRSRRRRAKRTTMSPSSSRLSYACSGWPSSSIT